jgi:hypothetical protein
MPRTVTGSPTSTFAARRPTDLAARRPSPHSMISRCGPPTRLPDARPRRELAGAARPIRRGQGRRDPRAATRGRRPAPTQPAPGTDVGRPGVPQRLGQAAAHAATPTPAGLATNTAAMVCPARGPPLDLPATTPGPTTHRATRAGAGAADGPREPTVGIPPHPRRTGRARPPDRRVNGVEDLEGRRHRSRSAPVRTDLAAVPGRAGSRDPRHRLRPRRHHLPAPPLCARDDRARPPPRTPRRDHRPPHRRLGHPTGPQTC